MHFFSLFLIGDVDVVKGHGCELRESSFAFNFLKILGLIKASLSRWPIAYGIPIWVSSIRHFLYYGVPYLVNVDLGIGWFGSVNGGMVRSIILGETF